jgi:uncharacterized protein (TIGR02266 family)
MNTNSADGPVTGQDSFLNRRVDERISARFEVHFARVQEAARALRAYSLNVSAGGLCLRTQRAYDVGTPVQMEMQIDGELLKLQGVIAWVRDESEAIGVRFTDMSDEARERLQRVIDSIKR